MNCGHGCIVSFTTCCPQGFLLVKIAGREGGKVNGNEENQLLLVTFHVSKDAIFVEL